MRPRVWGIAGSTFGAFLGNSSLNPGCHAYPSSKLGVISERRMDQLQEFVQKASERTTTQINLQTLRRTTEQHVAMHFVWNPRSGSPQIHSTRENPI
eukprot:1426957-Amphidinium_carterae.1